MQGNLFAWLSNTLNYFTGHSIFTNGFHTASPSHGYKYALVMVCMFSHWTYVFSPFRQVTAPSVAKILLEKIMSSWGTPLELHSDWVTHFIGQVHQKVCATWTLVQHFVLTTLNPHI